MSQWETVDLNTPAQWRQFYGKQVGSSRFGLLICANIRIFTVGWELVWGDTKALAIFLGPIFFAFARLRRKGESQ